MLLSYIQLYFQRVVYEERFKVCNAWFNCNNAVTSFSSGASVIYNSTVIRKCNTVNCFEYYDNSIPDNDL